MGREDDREVSAELGRRKGKAWLPPKWLTGSIHLSILKQKDAEIRFRWLTKIWWLLTWSSLMRVWAVCSRRQVDWWAGCAVRRSTWREPRTTRPSPALSAGTRCTLPAVPGTQTPVPQQQQVLKVIWREAASPSQADGSVVFVRWRQCASTSNTWFLEPSKSTPKTTSQSVAQLTAESPYTLQRAAPIPPRNCPFAWGSGAPSETRIMRSCCTIHLDWWNALPHMGEKPKMNHIFKFNNPWWGHRAAHRQNWTGVHHAQPWTFP